MNEHACKICIDDLMHQLPREYQQYWGCAQPRARGILGQRVALKPWIVVESWYKMETQVHGVSSHALACQDFGPLLYRCAVPYAVFGSKNVRCQKVVRM